MPETIFDFINFFPSISKTIVLQWPNNYYVNTTSTVRYVVWPQLFTNFENIRGARRWHGEVCGEIVKDGSDTATTRKFVIFPLSCLTAPAPSSSVKELLESPYHIICIYSIFGLQIIYINKDNLNYPQYSNL